MHDWNESRIMTMKNTVLWQCTLSPYNWLIKSYWTPSMATSWRKEPGGTQWKWQPWWPTQEQRLFKSLVRWWTNWESHLSLIQMVFGHSCPKVSQRTFKSNWKMERVIRSLFPAVLWTGSFIPDSKTLSSKPLLIRRPSSTQPEQRWPYFLRLMVHTRPWSFLLQKKRTRTLKRDTVFSTSKIE